MKIYNENIHDDADIDVDKFDSTSVSRARAYCSAQFNVANATWTKVEFDTESYDNLGEYTGASTYRFTAITAGYYLVTTSLEWGTAVANKRYISAIYKNGANVAFNITHSSLASNVSSSVTDIVYLAATDYVEGWAYQNSGESDGISAGTHASFITIHKLS